MGNLLPASEGTGVVVPDKNTFGTLDLGGASTQIAFFVPEQDISEGLFKLQIGSQKHWNVYTKSFLQFGVVSARKRHLAAVADSFFYNKNNTFIGDIPLLVDHCFHSGYSEPSYDTLKNRKVDITGPAVPAQDQLYRCMEAVRPLMEKQYGVFCRSVYHGDCSIAGSYQPPIPSGKHGNFIGTSTYRYAWQFLQLPDTCSLMEFEERASRICSMTFGELIYYSQTVKDLGLEPEKLASFLPYYCFLSSYVLVLLRG